MNRKEYQLRNEIKRLQNVLDYKKTLWEVNYMKHKKETLPMRDWSRTGEQAKKIYHATKSASRQGLVGIKYNLPRVSTYGIKRGYSVPRANLKEKED